MEFDGRLQNPPRIPQSDALTPEQWAIMDRLQAFAAKLGTPHWPCTPALAASFLDSCEDSEALAVVSAIVTAADVMFMSNPCATGPVRAALSRKSCEEFPPSFNAQDRLVFANMDVAMRDIILRRERERDVALRKKQGQLDQELKKLKGATQEVKSDNSGTVASTS